MDEVAKICPKCNRTLGADSFNKDASRKDGLYPWCRSCTHERKKELREADIEGWRERKRAYAKANPEKIREQRRREKYGATPEHLAFVKTIQGDGCGICGGSDFRELSLDHCHATGKLRGLLCSKCNLALGHLNDDPELLRRAADYLEWWGHHG